VTQSWRIRVVQSSVAHPAPPARRLSGPTATQGLKHQSLCWLGRSTQLSSAENLEHSLVNHWPRLVEVDAVDLDAVTEQLELEIQMVVQDSEDRFSDVVFDILSK
jgi:hypothetical protein